MIERSLVVVLSPKTEDDCWSYEQQSWSITIRGRNIYGVVKVAIATGIASKVDRGNREGKEYGG